MVIKGKSRGNGRQLGSYLLSKRDNDIKPEILEMRGFADSDPITALVNSERDVALISKSKKPFYQGILNPREGEAANMTADQWLESVNIIEKWLGYEGLPRLAVRHTKGGRQHVHVAWLRYDHVTSKLRPDSYNFYKHNSARNEIEVTLGHERTPKIRNKTKEPGHKLLLTQLWEQANNADDFVNQAQAAGYEIGRGLDQHPYRVITPEGKSLDLVRQLDGYRKKDVQERFKSYSLPFEVQALKVQQERLQSRQQGAKRPTPNQLMIEFINNSQQPVNDNKSDIMEELRQQMEQNKGRKHNRGFEY
ncbi:relaxase/mobilization nuclease domain-containing protein [Runella zeae]|uniref:relaxase/mobilization nuclease domain-containing protein n=1 Tax=Runella zeae TaxID=94255 RepID=UPI0003FE29CB|nr:hypothetical protein [Runella zeae]